MAVVTTDKEFKDITSQKLKTSSRLNTYNNLTITETNQHFLNHFRSFELSPDIKNDNNYFIIHVALENEWWDNISAQYYDTPYYWFILCELNNIINPYEELVAGQTVKVLKVSYMYDIFKELRGISKL